MTGHPSRFAVTLILSVSLITASCTASANNKLFFGKTDPPRDNVMRYVSGSEPETLDPAISDGQPEARIYMALYEGLVEYDPKTTVPIPALAERWEANKDSSEFTFHLRHNGRFSNGDPITAADFVYTIQRGLSPALASRNAGLAYYIKYAQAYNEGAVFVRDPANGQFLIASEFEEAPAKAATDSKAEAPKPHPPLSSQPVESVAAEYPPIPLDKTPDADTPFHRLMHSPDKLVLPSDDKKRSQIVDANPKLKAALVGKTFVPVEAKDIGVEAVDDFTFRISLTQPAPFFLSLMPHQFFRVVDRKVIEKFGNAWTLEQNIVTSGPFKLAAWKHYDRVIVQRDPMYWDAGQVKLDGIVFYAVVESSTIMNLYKAGEIDAMLNHNVQASWLDMIAPYKDYMDAPEAATEFYLFNCTRPPTSDVRVRKALNMSVDKNAVGAWRHQKPLTSITPEGMFPGYPQPKGDPFDPDKAKTILADAGYRDGSGKFDPAKFPVDQIEITINPDGNNIPMAEFIQAQWKQNLGVTIPIKVMEQKTSLVARAKLEYKGIFRTGWGADYMDPFTFLGLYYTPTGNNGTGWWDPKYAALLDEANSTGDQHKRFELLAKAEAIALDAQPVMPLMTTSARWMKKPYIKGMYPNAASLFAWKWVYIERDQAKWDYGVPSMASP
ncbi:MAG: oligopeptide transport system substrate-binding protein [Blastocatellia bacterium]|jgi:oligopeptide transport system substrate-binding protein|nr:oligopeptide transport system substrate-binding protein [Blastocatellia bacterium]